MHSGNIAYGFINKRGIYIQKKYDVVFHPNSKLRHLDQDNVPKNTI